MPGSEFEVQRSVRVRRPLSGSPDLSHTRTASSLNEQEVQFKLDSLQVRVCVCVRCWSCLDRLASSSEIRIQSVCLSLSLHTALHTTCTMHVVVFMPCYAVSRFVHFWCANKTLIAKSFSGQSREETSKHIEALQEVSQRMLYEQGCSV